jgi:hypothetical protein
MVEKKKPRFDSHVNCFYFCSERDFLGKGEQGTVVRAYPHGDLRSKPFALKIIRKAKLTGKFLKWMYREI